MADQDQPQQQLPEAPFPAPPPFWRHFTKANEDKLKEVEAEGGESQAKLPIPLAYLRPPPPPPDSAEFYTTFGQNQVIDPTKPSSLPREQLLFNPDDPDLSHAVLLSKLTKSLLLNFLELTSVLSLDPTKYEEKMEDIRQLVLNIHVVINMYRPHQARESVKEMLEGFLEDGEKEIDECDRLKSRAEDLLDDIGKMQSLATTATSAEANGSLVNGAGHDAKMEEQSKVWQMLHEIADS
ncbi:hypothetical protein PV11_08197 [Exophiala sideris]|uniref:Mediator of RNA polymerase II transcription subunit 7 n=1 Tax=Exophiala sideris TaxID=1016849 RepID=A0A0D1Z1C9_9EURO|nr:hypothetical protein PV11_08197 [Exophiala sideris]